MPTADYAVAAASTVIRGGVVGPGDPIYLDAREYPANRLDYFGLRNDLRELLISPGHEVVLYENDFSKGDTSPSATLGPGQYSAGFSDERTPEWMIETSSMVVRQTAGDSGPSVPSIPSIPSGSVLGLLIDWVQDNPKKSVLSAAVLFVLLTVARQ